MRACTCGDSCTIKPCEDRTSLLLSTTSTSANSGDHDLTVLCTLFSELHVSNSSDLCAATVLSSDGVSDSGAIRCGSLRHSISTNSNCHDDTGGSKHSQPCLLDPSTDTQTTCGCPFEDKLSPPSANGGGHDDGGDDEHSQPSMPTDLEEAPWPAHGLTVLCLQFRELSVTTTHSPNNDDNCALRLEATPVGNAFHYLKTYQLPPDTSPTTRALWPQAPSPVVRALQLQCDHRRVYMRSFNAKAERRLARQFLNEWHATTTTTKATVSSEASTLKGLRRDLSLSINGNAIDARPRCRQHRTIGPTSTIRAPKDPARHRESSPLTNRLLPSCEK